MPTLSQIELPQMPPATKITASRLIRFLCIHLCSLVFSTTHLVDWVTSLLGLGPTQVTHEPSALRCAAHQSSSDTHYLLAFLAASALSRLWHMRASRRPGLECGRIDSDCRLGQVIMHSPMSILNRHLRASPTRRVGYMTTEGRVSACRTRSPRVGTESDDGQPRRMW